MCRSATHSDRIPGRLGAGPEQCAPDQRSGAQVAGALEVEFSSLRAQLPIAGIAALTTWPGVQRPVPRAMPRDEDLADAGVGPHGCHSQELRTIRAASASGCSRTP
jgi:hypothetical protein